MGTGNVVEILARGVRGSMIKGVPQRSSVEEFIFRSEQSSFRHDMIPPSSRLFQPSSCAHIYALDQFIASCGPESYHIFVSSRGISSRAPNHRRDLLTAGADALACMCRPWTPPLTRPRCYLKQLKRPREKRQGPRRTPCRSAVTLVPKCLPPKPFE